MVVPSNSYNGLGAIHLLAFLYVGYNAAREFKGTPASGVSNCREVCHWRYNNATSLKTKMLGRKVDAIYG